MVPSTKAGRTVPVSRLGLRSPDRSSTQTHAGARCGYLARPAAREKAAEPGPGEGLHVLVTSGDWELKTAEIVSLFQGPGTPAPQVRIDESCQLVQFKARQGPAFHGPCRALNGQAGIDFASLRLSPLASGSLRIDESCQLVQFKAQQGPALHGPCWALNGQAGIRTLGTLLEYASLAKKCFRPLSHLTCYKSPAHPTSRRQEAKVPVMGGGVNYFVARG